MKEYLKPDTNPHIKTPQELASFVNNRYVHPRPPIMFEVVDYTQESNNIYGLKFNISDWRVYEPVIERIETDNILKILYDCGNKQTWTYIVQVPE